MIARRHPWPATSLSQRPVGRYRDPMNNMTALFLALVILAGLAVDLIFLDGSMSLYVAKQGLALLDWIAVWR